MRGEAVGRSRKVAYRVAGAISLIAATLAILHAVFTSTSSTAAVGLLFIPVYAPIAAALGVAVLFVGFSAFDLLTGRTSLRHGSPWAALGLLVLFVLAGLCFVLKQRAVSLASDPSASPASLREVSERWLPFGKRQVDEALAKNTATPEDILESFGGQTDHYIVYLVGSNPRTPVRVLEKIAEGELTYDRVAGIAKNPRITPAIMGRLVGVTGADFPGPLEYKLYQSQVLAALARQPEVPREIFDRLAAWEAPEYFLSLAVIQAPQARCDQISRFLKITDNAGVLNAARTQLRAKKCQDSSAP
jgi:hypothetical protein